MAGKLLALFKNNWEIDHFDFIAIITNNTQVLHGLYVVDESSPTTLLQVHYTHQFSFMDIP